MPRSPVELSVEVTELPPLTVRHVVVSSRFVMGDGHPRTEGLQEDLEDFYGAAARLVRRTKRMKSSEVDVVFYDGYET